MRTEIIYEDKDILVVYKPAGLATQTARLGQADVVSELKNYLKQAYLGIIHRLDQPVEGLLVFAKHQKAAADLTAQLQKQGEGGSLHKHYYAAICGQNISSSGRLVDYMYKSKDNLAVIVEKKPGMRKEDLAQAREAVLEYRILAQGSIAGAGEVVQESQTSKINHEAAPEGVVASGVDGIFLALADIHIFTGRFHQIRAQMAHGGMPLLGDVKYGSAESKDISRKLSVQNVALCAYCLDFVHPITKKEMHFQVDPKGNVFGYFRGE